MTRPLAAMPRRHRPASSTRMRRPVRFLTGCGLELLECRALLAAPTSFAIGLPPGAIFSPLAGEAPGGSVQGMGSDQTATAGAGTNFSALASFTVPGSVLDAGPFQANVIWGDGTMNDQATPESLGAGGPAIDVVGPIYGVTGADPNAQYDLKFDDSHTFAQPGTYTFTVTFLTGYEGTPVATTTGSVTVSAAASPGGPVVGHGYDLTATAGVSTPLWTLATFEVPASLGTGHSVTAAVDWGDGTPGRSGWITPGAVEDAFSGQHVYAAAGTYTFTVTLLQDGVAVGSASGTYTVSAGDNTGGVPGQGTDQTTTAGADTTFDRLATFNFPASMFESIPSSITIDWGDGTQAWWASGATWARQGDKATESVAGEHTFAKAGTYTYTVTYADIVTGEILGTATGTVTVAPGDPTQGGSGTAVPPDQSAPPIVVDGPIPLSPPVAFSPIATAPGPQPGQPAAPTIRATTQTTAPSLAASARTFRAADLDVILEGLWAGLYAGPTSTLAAPTSTPAGSTAPANPLHPDVRYWDAGLELLAT
jgi:plastocyanin